MLSNTPWLTVEDALGPVPAQPVPGAAHRGGVGGAGAGARHRAEDQVSIISNGLCLYTEKLRDQYTIQSIVNMSCPPVSAGIVTVVELRIPGGCHRLLHQEADTRYKECCQLDIMGIW